MSASRTILGTGCFLLFALPFAAVGAVMAWSVGAAVWSRVATSTWEETTAELHEVELVTKQGEDELMYEVRARYTYRFRGKLHDGDRVGIHEGADSIGSWQRDTYRELEAYRRTGRPAPCFVNPRDPSQAVLIRDLRWRLLTFKIVFAVVFGGAGFGLLALVWFGRGAMLDKLRLQREHPDEPWMWRRDWAERRVRGAGRAELWFPCAMAIFWNAFGLLMVIFALDESGEDRSIPLIAVALVVGIGVGLAVWAGRVVLRWRRFGDSVLELDAVPIPVGGRLAGTLLAAGDVGPGVDFELTASCVRKGGGEHSDKVLWERRWRVEGSRIESGGDRLRVPVAVDLPADIEPGLFGEWKDDVGWRLEAKAELPGVDYGARFELPVFGRVEPAPGSEPAPRDDAAAAAESAMREAGLVLEPLPAGGTRLVFPRRRQPGPAAALAVALVMGLFVLGFFYFEKFPAVVIWLAGAALLVALFTVLDFLFRERSVAIDSRGLVLSSALFGRPRTRRLEREEIAEVKTARGFQAGSRLYYRVVVRDCYGRRHVAAAGLAGEVLAESVVAVIEAELDRGAPRDGPRSG